MHSKINLYIHLWGYIYICIYKIYLRMFGKMQQKVESIRNSYQFVKFMKIELFLC